jgi:hypothetical protein
MSASDRRRFIWVWTDSARERRCRGPQCGARLTFVELVRTRTTLPIDGPLTFVETREELDPKTGAPRMAGLIDLADVHFARCPDADAFRRAR